MTPDIRLIAFDLDGTLLDADHAAIPRRNIAALRAAADRGVKLAIASGRSWSLVRDTAADLGGVDYGITSNGGFVYDAGAGAQLAKFPMDCGQAARIVDVLRKWGLYYEVYVDGENYVQLSELEGAESFSLSDSFLEVFRKNMTPVEDMRALVSAVHPEKFDIFYVPPHQRQAVMEDLSATGPLAPAGALGTNLELTAAGVNKGLSLAALTERLGLGPEQVMAFGDADNDLEMLRYARWSFAMGNATPEARAAARFTTGTNCQGGVGMAVERYLLRR